MTAAPKYPPWGSCIAGIVSRAEPVNARARPMSCGRSVRSEEDRRTKRMGPTGTRRGRGPSAFTQIVEITSGRTIFQQGLVATCEDPPEEAKARDGGRKLVWRMSPHERGRRGNSLRGGTRGHPWRGNSSKGQRGSGHLAVPGLAQTQSWDNQNP